MPLFESYCEDCKTSSGFVDEEIAMEHHTQHSNCKNAKVVATSIM